MAQSHKQRRPGPGRCTPLLLLAAVCAAAGCTAHTSTGGRGGPEADTAAVSRNLIQRARAAKRTIVAVGNSPSLGPKDARVTVIVFADFKCPHSAKSVSTRKLMMAEHAGLIRWVFKYRQIFPWARPAALAAAAAHRLGRFWDYHDLLFARQEQLSDAGLEDTARLAGLDGKLFKEALANPDLAQDVEADLAAAREAGVRGVPTYIINGRPLVGNLGIERTSALIAEELAYAQLRLDEGNFKSYAAGVRPADGAARQAADRDSEPAPEEPEEPKQGDALVGVPECDEYLAKYKRCILDKAPEADLAGLQAGLENLAKDWRKMAGDEARRSTLAKTCKKVSEMTAKSMRSLGCKW